MRANPFTLYEMLRAASFRERQEPTTYRMTLTQYRMQLYLRDEFGCGSTRLKPPSLGQWDAKSKLSYTVVCICLMQPRHNLGPSHPQKVAT
jgi:hypothetical protein